MNDLIPEEKYTPTNVLAKRGVSAIACLAGGTGLLLLAALGARFPIMGIAAGAVLGIVGIGAVRSKDADDHKPGLVVLAAGVLSVLSRVPGIRIFAGTLLGIGAVGLLATGIWNGIRFLTELRKRA
ncbi:MAG: hypothetical protein LBH70_07085 [Spirochaetaceae bacterium]|jgi:hypothetical protein|nr:hypothetical protein [Spirochaetaceae bacterium]